jgi:hypothetical protein
MIDRRFEVYSKGVGLANDRGLAFQARARMFNH